MSVRIDHEALRRRGAKLALVFKWFLNGEMVTPGMVAKIVDTFSNDCGECRGRVMSCFEFPLGIKDRSEYSLHASSSLLSGSPTPEELVERMNCRHPEDVAFMKFMVKAFADYHPSCCGGELSYEEQKPFLQMAMQERNKEKKDRIKCRIIGFLVVLAALILFIALGI